MLTFDCKKFDNDVQNKIKIQKMNQSPNSHNMLYNLSPH